MASTTTELNAKDARIVLNGIDISGSSNEVELTPEFAVGEFYVFDDDWRQVLPGKRQWSVRIQAVYSETAGEAVDVIWDAWWSQDFVPIEIKANTVGVGDWEWSGRVLVPNPGFPFVASDANPILVGVDCPGHGELTKTTIVS